MPPKTTFLLSVCAIAWLTAIVTAQSKPTIDEALQQLRAGDPFRAVLTLNDVIGQSAGDAASVARAQSIRAAAFLQMEQPERAKAAVDLALKADPNYAPSAADVSPATISLFAAARAPAPANSEATADAAEKAGRYQEAFLAYLSAYQALPNPAPAAEERRLRERIIRVVSRLTTAPIVPQAALDHARRADQLLEAEAVLGSTGGASSRSAEEQLLQALRIAPWWPEATFKLATVQQRLQRVDEALANLNLYKLADPQGASAALAARTAAAATPATTAPPARTATVPQPAGRGTIIIYRVSNYFGSASRAWIECNGQRMAELQNGRVVRFTAPAGKIKLEVRGDDPLELDVAPGAEYYFRTGPGGMNFNTRAVGVEEGKAYLKEKKPKPNDAKRTMTLECKTLMP